MQDTMIADIDFYNYPSFIFKRKSHIFIGKKKHNTPEKVAIDEEEQMVMI